MISSEHIQQAVERLVAAANPSKVILFGSYARGDATEDSDLDLMVIEQEVANKFDEMVRLRNVMGDIGVGVDYWSIPTARLTVVAKCQERFCTGHSRKGRVMYDARH